MLGGGSVKWFQCDSNTPNEPDVKSIIRAGLDPPSAQQAAAGALLLLWCYIAAYGEAEPGVGVKADGGPLNLREMASECHFRDTDTLRRFLGECAENDHIDRDAWSGKGIVILLKMRARADNYTKRTLRQSSPDVRTVAAQEPKLPVLSCTSDLSEVLDVPEGTLTGAAALGLPLEGANQVDGLVALWNELADPSLPRVRKPSPTRRDVFARALRAHPDLSQWRALIVDLNTSHWWLHGGKEHPNWRGDLDYLCQGSGTKFERAYEKMEARKRAAATPQSGSGKDGRNGRVIPIMGKYDGLQNRG